MERRSFLRLALAPLAAAAAAHAGALPPVSRAARAGMLPNVPLVTHAGERVMFYDDLVRGRTVLINFFYVQCTDGACPTATATLRKVQDLLGERMGRDVFFYSVSLTPELDTPRILKAYAENFEVKPGWTFLTGRRPDVERLRRGMGFVDSDPKRDRDVANHTGMGRYGNDRLERWGGISLSTSPEHIASTFKWLSA